MAMSLSYKLKLIDIVERFPDLWRGTKKAAKLKQKLWNDVGTELGKNGFDVRRQWEILRDQFRREYKRQMHNRTYVSKWVLYDRMLFVRHALRPNDGRAYRSDSENEEQGSEGQQQSEELDVQNELTEEKYIIESDLVELPKIQVRQDLQGSTDSSLSQVTISASVEEKPSTSAGVSSSHQRFRYDEFGFASSKKRRRWRADSSEDEDYHFAMSILPSMRSLQHTKKLRVRAKIMELIATELDADLEKENQLQSVMQYDLRTIEEPEKKFTPDNFQDKA